MNIREGHDRAEKLLFCLNLFLKWTKMKKNIPGLSIKARFGLLFIALIIVFLDQISKYVARNNLELFEICPF